MKREELEKMSTESLINLCLSLHSDNEALVLELTKLKYQNDLLIDEVDILKNKKQSRSKQKSSRSKQKLPSYCKDLIIDFDSILDI